MKRKLLLGAASSLFILSTGCLPARIVRYNFANITDEKVFPSRPLLPAEAPQTFLQAATPIRPKSITIRGKETDFETFLAQHQTVAFLIIRNDTLFYEKYFAGYGETSKVASFSMAKSFTSALIGAAIADGYIKSVEQPVTDFIPEIAAQGFDKVTIRHLLQMTAGLKFEESYANPFGDAGTFYYGRNLRKHTKNIRLKEPAGKEFDYTSGSTQLLGLVLDKALKGKTVTAYLQEKIWSPAGMKYPATWSIDQQKDGLEKTFCCLNATAVDFARFGKLYADSGRVAGRQVLPQDWVTTSSQPDTSEGGVRYYKYQWWMLPGNSPHHFFAQGILGQFVYVEPAKKLIIVRLGKSPGGVPWSRLMQQMAAGL